jgi:PAS domain S-box-containing protein
MNFRTRVAILGVSIVLFTMLISMFTATTLVLNQSGQDARGRLEEAARRITDDLKNTEYQYADRVRRYAETDNVIMYTNVLYKYHSYFTPEGLHTVRKDLCLELSKLKIGLNVDIIEVYDKKMTLLGRNSSADGGSTVSTIPEPSPNQDVMKAIVTNDEVRIKYLIENGNLLFMASTPIRKRDEVVGYLVLKKNLDPAYIKATAVANGTEIAFFHDQKFLAGTIDPFSFPQKVPSEPILLKSRGHPYRFLFVPIFFDNGSTFYMAIGLSDAGTIRKMNETRNTLIGVALFAVTLAFILTYFWSGSIVGPLLRLVGAVQAISRGDLKQKISVENSDEIGLLASEFNKMTTSLKESRDQLETVNRDLYDMKEYISNIVESMTVSVIVIGLNYQVTMVNSEFEKVFGCPRTELIGEDVTKLIRFDAEDDFRWQLRSVMDSLKTKILNKTQCLLNHKKITANLHLSPMMDVNKVLTGIVIIIEDVTNYINLEERLAFSQKMASIGTLAAGLAHEVNNPLGIILNYLEVMMMDSNDHKSLGYLKRLQSETERIAKIIQRLLEFSRKSETKFEPIELMKELEVTLEFVDYRLRKQQIQLIRDYQLKEAWVTGDKNLLKQVFLNIILNAAQAMENGGSLSIKVSETIPGEEYAIIFTDTGKGISSEHLNKVFDPFYTTKKIGEGTGMGLTISYGIIQEHGGTIDVESRKAEGTQVTIKLKRNQKWRKLASSNDAEKLYHLNR